MKNFESETIAITEEEAGIRLDKILANRYQSIQSRSYFQTLIRDQKVFLNGEPIKKHFRPKLGDVVDICFVIIPEMDLNPEPIPLDVVFEDDHILVVNKPAQMVVHPAPGNWSGTFVNAFLHHCKSLSVAPHNLRPGIVHRLDKETSGILVAAKSSLAQQRLVEMFANRQVYKEYIALCWGNPGEGMVDAPIGRHPVHRKKMAVRDEGGRSARTIFKTRTFDGTISLVEILLETGRTHQIRVHMQYHPYLFL